MKRIVLPSIVVVVAGALALVALPAAGIAADGTTAAAAAPPATGVVAYYFHGNFRCKTCLAIERLSRETITAEFPDELSSGRLTWRAVNVEEPDNEHFVRDFELTTRSLVLVSYEDGKVVRHRNLDKVWQLVHDEGAFSEYVREAARAFLASD